MQEYRHSNRVTAMGLVLLALCLLLGGPVIGGLAFLASKLIYLPLLFPVVMGIASGELVARSVVKGRTRNLIVVAGFCALFAATAYGSMHFAKYVEFRGQVQRWVVEELLEEYGPAAEAVAGQWASWFLAAETGSSGFWGYAKLAARSGVTFTHVLFDFAGAQQEASGISLHGSAVWAYWLFEMGVLGYAAYHTARSTAAMPFCERCQLWYTPGEHIGSVAMASSDAFMSLVRGDALEEAAALVSQQNLPPPSLELYSRQCADCRDGLLEVSRASAGQRGKLQFEHVFTGVMSRDQRALFIRRLQTPA